MASSLRPRKSVNYRILNDGEPIPTGKTALKSKPRLLDDTYLVDRLIWRKKEKDYNTYQYLVKWQDYHTYDATWEPEGNLPKLVIQNYLPASVSTDKLQQFSESLERAVQSRLKCRSPAFSVYVDLDIFRYVFGDSSSVLCEKNDFDKLNLPDNWYYIAKKDGTGRKLKFPIRVSVRLYFRKTYVKIDGKLVLKEKPIAM